jgi:hypothetical protein
VEVGEHWQHQAVADQARVANTEPLRALHATEHVLCELEGALELDCQTVPVVPIWPRTARATRRGCGGRWAIGSGGTWRFLRLISSNLNLSSGLRGKLLKKARLRQAPQAARGTTRSITRQPSTSRQMMHAHSYGSMPAEAIRTKRT